MEISEWEAKHLALLDTAVTDLVVQMDNIFSPIHGERVEDNLEKAITNYRSAVFGYYERFGNKANETLLSIYTSARKVTTNALRLITQVKDLQRYPEGVLQVASEAAERIILLVKELEQKPGKVDWVPTFRPQAAQVEAEVPVDGTSSPLPTAEELDALKAKAVDIESLLLEISRRVESRFEQLNARSESEFQNAQAGFLEEIEKMRSEFEHTRKFVTGKSKEVDVLVAAVSGKALSNGYIRNAVREQRIADIFRNSAIFLMVAIGLYVIGTVLHMEWYLLDPRTATLRAVGALFFSFVIAYLIRQSAVHRGQQHKHLQTGLDLLALGPYMAELTPEVRGTIRQHVAEKIFVPKEALAATDNGGFGATELVSKIIDKLELPKKG